MFKSGNQLSGRRDSNSRPPAPKAGALTGLRYAPVYLNSYNRRGSYRCFPSISSNPAAVPTEFFIG